MALREDAGHRRRVTLLTPLRERDFALLFVLVAIYGAAEAFFIPAFNAIVPTLVAAEQFTAASALGQFVRPLTAQLLGPALGGALLALTDVGVDFLVDAGTFLISIMLTLSMRRTPATRSSSAAKSLRATLGEIADGFRLCAPTPWLWGTLVGASLSLLAFFGPSQAPAVRRMQARSGPSACGDRERGSEPRPGVRPK